MRAGIDRVTQMLRMESLIIHPRCTEAIVEMEGYSWKENKDGESNKHEAPIKSHDHILDALRYVAMSRPDWFARDETDMYGVLVDKEELDFEPDNDEEIVSL